MKELVEIKAGYIGATETQTVNARDLYAALGLDKSNWSRWSQSNIVMNEFALETVDYQGFVIMTNGNETTEYALTIQFAKKLAMQAKTAKGEQVRDYFIECERRVNEPVDPIAVLNDPSAMRGILLSYTERVLALEAEAEVAAPKVEFYDAYLNADGLYGLQNAARALNCRPNLFIRWLKTKYLFYQGGNLVAKVQYIQSGLFEVKTTLVDDKARPQAFITPKGLKHLEKHVPSSVRMKDAG